jgi:hypothetical protein
MPSVDPDLIEALNSVRRIVRADRRDWAANRHDAFIYGLFQGWDDAEPSVASRHDWDDTFLARMHRLHASIDTVLPN